MHVLVAALSWSLSGSVDAAMARVQREPDQTTNVLAISRPETRSSQRLRVSSPSVGKDGLLPERFGGDGKNLSPAVRWSGAPAGTRSFVVLMEDPDAQMPKPFVHWVVYNLPSGMTEIHEGVRPSRRVPPALGAAVQGPNSNGTPGYVGPRPRKLDPPHRYHLQVFALDSVLTFDRGATRDGLLKAMSTHVLAAGEVVALYAARPVQK